MMEADMVAMNGRIVYSFIGFTGVRRRSIELAR